MQQGGSPYGAPPFHHAVGMGAPTPPEAAPPISAIPPPINYEELGATDDPLGGPAEDVCGGGGGMSGNRWPRQETLALLKIRSDMDAAFRDATLKGPLWEEVSRKLAELGYKRSSKKCKEKFENVHKYYKRTKDGRAGRQDGKSYRFFTHLEALHNTAAATSPSAAATAAPPPIAVGMNKSNNPSPPSAMLLQPPMQISAPTPITTAPPAVPQPSMVHGIPNTAAAGISFSSNTDSSLGSEDDDEATEEGPSAGGCGKKRKREQGGNSGGFGAGGRKMMAFFEGLMRQVVERQEATQQRFLEAIEKREQDRMIREEAWRRQEMSRLTREHELAAQDRAAAAARDATIISFLQKVTGQTVQLSPAAAASATVLQAPPPLPVLQPQIHHQTPPQQQHHQQAPPTPPSQVRTPIQHEQQPPPTTVAPATQASKELVPVPVPSAEAQEGTVVSVIMDPASSRWPKSEVHALIKIRSGLDFRYQETGPKGPLWEEISAAMQRLGYNRSAKRCKEKWENINKYFKKVKESNKKRPDDAKTCPYFHQLDELYRSKHQQQQQLGNSGASALAQLQPELQHETHQINPKPISMILPPQPQAQHQAEMEGKNGNVETGGGAAPSNGGIPSSFFVEGGGGDNDSGILKKKPEDIMKELMGHSSNNNGLADSDNMDEDDEDDDEDDGGEGQYRIQFQRSNVVSSTTTTTTTVVSAAAPSSTAAAGGKASGSFLAMVR